MALLSERRFISYQNIKSGMLLEFDYKKESIDKRKTYTVLVIDPVRKNDHSKYEQLHGLLIDDLSDQELYKLIISVGQSVDFNPYDRHSPLTNLKTDAAYNRYRDRLSSERRYRTFNKKNITFIRQILIGRPDDEDVL